MEVAYVCSSSLKSCSDELELGCRVKGSVVESDKTDNEITVVHK